MSIVIREARAGDAAELGRICYAAFASIAGEHNFPPDFPSTQVTTGLMTMLISNRGVYGVVAEDNGRLVGSNFLAEQGAIAGVGPVSVDPEVQNNGIGAQLMRSVMDRSAAKGHAGIRLVQAGYHCRSLSLYSRLGFDVREHLTCMLGDPIGKAMPGYAVRPAAERDLAACNALCARVHGMDRAGELRGALSQGTARVVEREGRITAYTTQVAFVGHTVAETNDDLKALIAASEALRPPGFLLPSRNGEMMRWCFGNGLRMTQPLTLMTIGLYNEPTGAWLPSILF
jgi:predicted N-acetyltransferase YhbS